MQYQPTALSPFSLSAKLYRTNCDISETIIGEITIFNSESPIKSIELQLVRLETVSYIDGVCREATEIQSIQIADGDVCRGISIPIYLVFPRLFTCPSITTNEFRIEFEINIIIYFAGGYCATESFPIYLYRKIQ